MIISQTQREGLSEEAARQKVFMVDRFGLLTDKMPNLLRLSRPNWCRSAKTLGDWDTDSDVLSLLDVVRNVKPDILIGVSGQTGLFTEEIIREMHKHCPRPIVMPLSNPTSRVKPHRRTLSPGPKVTRWSPLAARLIQWYGKIKSTLSPSVTTPDFPGHRPGVIASGASRITDEMLMSASETLTQYSPLVLNGEGLVLPELKDIQKVSRAIAFAVGKMAQQQGVAVKTSAEALQQAIDDNFWQAEYRDYRRTSI